MIKSNQFRTGNVGLCLECDGITMHIGIVDHILYNKVSAGDWRIDEPLVITKEILRDNLGFTVTDMGEFWSFELDGFELIQVKSQLIKKEMSPFFILHSKQSKHIKFEHVHRLQNFYFEVLNKELIYKVKPNV